MNFAGARKFEILKSLICMSWYFLWNKKYCLLTVGDQIISHLQYLQNQILTHTLLRIYSEIFWNTKCSYIQLQFRKINM